MKRNSLKITAAIFVINALMAVAAHSQTFKTVVEFNGVNGGNPVGPVVRGADGAYYGVTQYGGNYSQCPVILGCGTVFKVSPQGRLTTLYEFCSQANCSDGISPIFGGLVLATDGNFYGTTFEGGTLNTSAGTVFKITPAGKLTTLYTFCTQADCLDGAGPSGALIQATDGNFYGTTRSGGGSCPGGCGTVFRITSGGILTTLHAFTDFNGDGATPISGVTQGPDGNFYGTTLFGANYSVWCVTNNDPGCGIAFRLTPAGEETILHTFCQDDPSCLSDGALPNGLLLASDGNFYGTTEGGAAAESGNIFKLTPQGQFTALYQFCSNPGCTDGGLPISTLIQGTDGALYGMTDEGGNSGCFMVGCGTVFKFTRGGKLTTIHSFQGTDGEFPTAGLTQSTNGYLLGTVYQGATSGNCWFTGCGTVFAMSTGLGPFVTFVQNAAHVGQTAQILGQGFTGTTSVAFNGVPASFTVVSDTFINAMVPAGATTGKVTVATSSRTLTSNVPFHVLP